MLKAKLKELLAVYQKLPYTLYKQKYLIPSPPILHRYCNTIYDKHNILNIYKKWLPDLVDQKLIERANKVEERSTLVDQYFRQINKRRNAYKNSVEKYYQTYISPLQRHQRTNPAFLYYNQNKEMFENYWKKNNREYNIADIYYLFGEQPAQIKKSYNEKAQAKYQLVLHHSKQQAEKHKIPELTRTYPQNIYVKEKYGSINVQFYKDYIALPETEKKLYIERASKANKEKCVAFMQFLKSKGITFQQFKLIKRTCMNIEIIKTQIKELKKQQKKQPQKIIQIEQEKNQALTFQESEKIKDENTKQQKQVKEKTYKKTQKQQSIEARLTELQNEMFEDQPQKVQNHQTKEVKPQQLSWDYNIDIENQVLDINELKRASANKVSKNKKKRKEN